MSGTGNLNAERLDMHEFIWNSR